MSTIAPYRIRAAEDRDIASWRLHLREHLEENGQGGVFFAPFSASESSDRFTPDRIAAAREAAARDLTRAGWLRVWLVEDSMGAIVGHGDLTGGGIPSEMHRCRVGIGLMRAHHRRGLGTALMRAMIAWARESGLAWMDLGVFGGNVPAIALYRTLGFVETGRTTDRFRVDGARITDIAMTLAL